MAIALKTQQILASESEVTNTVDPMAGSYFLEKLTLEMERGCWDYFEKIDALGGMVSAIECCFPQKEIQEAAYQYQRAVERKEKIIVGVNDYLVEEESPIETLYINQDVANRQVARLRELKTSRNRAEVKKSLTALRKAAASSDNLMPHFVACVSHYATLGEICDELRSAFGTYVEPIF